MSRLSGDVQQQWERRRRLYRLNAVAMLMEHCGYSVWEATRIRDSLTDRQLADLADAASCPSSAERRLRVLAAVGPTVQSARICKDCAVSRPDSG